jgi:flavin-dependent dehydrogenase
VTDRRDALVIGAGPAGATAAILLARAGWSVAIAEKSAFPRRKVCGEYISATTWPVLRSLGIAEALRTQAGPAVRSVGLFARDTVVAAPMPAALDAAEGWGRAVRREILDTALLDEATRAGAQAWQPWSVVELHDANPGYTATLQHAATRKTRTLDCAVVVAAHGSWLRGSLATQQSRHEPRASDLFGFKAHFRGARLPAGLMPLVLFPGGYGGMVHADEGRASFSCCIRRDALARCRAEHPGLAAGEALITHVIETCAGVRDALSGAIREDAWLSAGPIDPGIRPRTRGGVFAIGNAAGEAHPLIAEGISMAIQSAWLLCGSLIPRREELLRGEALVEAGREYSRNWRRQFATRLHAAAIFAQLTTAPATAAASAAILERVPSLLTWGARWSGKARGLRLQAESMS